MKRKIYLELEVDERKAIEFAEETKTSYGTLDYLENKMKKLKDSGINLEKALISDVDDTEEWGRYIDYVFAWAFTNRSNDNCPKILTYQEWKSKDKIASFFSTVVERDNNV